MINNDTFLYNFFLFFSSMSSYYEKKGGLNMKATRNQTERFNRKYRKNELDLQAIYEPKIKEEVPGEAVLRAKGNFDEAAAVFTHEGIQTFVQMLTNSTERQLEQEIERLLPKLADHLSPLIEAMVREALIHALERMLTGLKEPDKVSEHPYGSETEEEPQPKESKREEPITEKNLTERPARRYRRYPYQEVGAFVVRLLQERGPMRKNEIFRAIEEAGYPTPHEPTFKKLVETRPEVVRVKHGIYGLRKD
jgi:hypothetical protein